MAKLTLAQAKEILPHYVTEDHLFKHAEAVSAAMGAMAGLFGGDKDHWEAIGYIHDVDYEKYPNEHCHHVREFLQPFHVDEEDIKSVISHGYGICTDETQPESDLEKSLFTVDELTGIVMAYALMRPEGITGMTVKGLKKKWKDKHFAEGCSREIIQKGMDMLGLDAKTVMQAVIDGMTEHKEELGLK
jgi:predicted hydrolase (HD superfamily)